MIYEVHLDPLSEAVLLPPSPKVQSLSAVLWWPLALVIFPHPHFVTQHFLSYLLRAEKDAHNSQNYLLPLFPTRCVSYTHFPKHHTSPCCVSYSTSLTIHSLLCPPHHPASWIFNNFKVTALLGRKESLRFSLEFHSSCLSWCKCPFVAPSSTDLQVPISLNSCILHAGSNHGREKTQPGSTHKISSSTRAQTCLRVTEPGFKTLGLIVFVWGFGLLFCGVLLVWFSKITSWVVTNP